jgi:hypothetical protein
VIDLTCDCGKVLRTKKENAGRKAKCPVCGRGVVVPGELGEKTPDGPAELGIDVGPKPQALMPASSSPPPNPREPSRPGSFVRWLLYMIAVFSGIYTVLSPFMAAADRARGYQDVSYAKYVGNLAGIIDAERKVRHDEDEAGANARTAVLVFTVALAGLAAPRERR